jgi:micrococcal nuclease
LLIVICILIGVACGYFWGYASHGPEIERASVGSIIDGDTIELTDGRTVRYLGIDTPETDEPYYTEATEKNRELVEGKVVELQCGHRDTDEYGRLLRYVYVDGVFVNAELVAQGYAMAYIFDPDDRYSQVLVQLEQYAKLRGRGLWGADE